MRPIQEPGFAPLGDDDREAMLREHIPYRLSLLLDGLRPAWAPACQHTNQAFEAGVVSGRILLSFLGLGYDRIAGTLREERKHHGRDSLTDDVKAPDVGGRFVDLQSLTPEEKNILARFILGAHKACAHFTIGSDHQFVPQTYADAGPIIFRLMKKCFPKHPESWPKWAN